MARSKFNRLASDGGTITAFHDGKPEKIRFCAFDCLEKRQLFGTRASQMTSALVFGPTVTVRAKHQDRYGWAVGIVTLPVGGI